MYGEGPWNCGECDTQVTVIGQGSNEGVIHHKDKDYLNNDPTNLEMMHHACHLRHHLVGVPMPDETRKKISATLKGRPSPTRGMTFSAETNAKKGLPGERNPFFGKTHSPEVREKIRAAHQGKPTRLHKKTCECGVVTYPGAMTSHMKASGHKLAEPNT